MTPNLGELHDPRDVASPADWGPAGIDLADLEPEPDQPEAPDLTNPFLPPRGAGAGPGS